MASPRSRLAALTVLAVCAGIAGAGIDRAAEPQPTKPKTVVVAQQPALTYTPPQAAVRPDEFAFGSPPTRFTATAGAQRASARGLRLIESFEGFSSCPYWDPYGRVWTRGYGETEGIRAGSPCISRSFGEQNLASRLARFYDYSIRGLGVSLNQNQFDALDSFVWNLGSGIFTGTLRYDLTHRQFFAASRVMLQYDHAGGQVLLGLQRRRQAEVALFLATSGPPAPPSKVELRARLYRDYRIRNDIRYKLTVHRCRVIHGKQAFRGCPDLARKGRAVNADIRRLHRQGV